MTRVSVIVPSFNSGNTITKTLDGLMEQPAELLAEIIVVDSSDDQRTLDVLRGYKKRGVKVIHLDEKTMPAIGRNIGAEQAKGDLLAFIDSDAYPFADWIERIVEARKKGYMVGGGSTYLPDYQLRSSIPLAQYYLQFNDCLDYGDDRIKEFVPSCNLFCDAELFRAAGGFPEIRAAEDVLFGFRVSRSAKVWFVPSVRIYHIYRESLDSYLANQRLIGKYTAYYRKIHYHNFLYRGVTPLFLLPAFTIMKVVRVFSRVGGKGRSDLWSLIKVFPHFLLGLFNWAAGFAQGCLSENEMPRLRGEV
jgi:glycosyltransferase involved in cell wall biosynthesis